jgi:FkbM family methyltransferase
VKRVGRLRVGLAQPVREYLRHAPTNRGRGFVYRHILRRILPPAPESFVVRRPGGSLVSLQYREVLGLSAFVSGGFEDAECRFLMAMTSPNSTAIDVGANVGIHAIPMAAASPSAKVLAIEPLPNNARRLRDNAEANSIENIDVIEVAVASDEGVVTLHVADDPAYASTDAVLPGHREIGQLAVEQTTLDAIWERAGRPVVSLIKIDVEGGELDVLNGAHALLASQLPTILIEALETRIETVASALAEYGYRPRTLAGLQPWNHVFQAAVNSRDEVGSMSVHDSAAT